MALAVLNAEAHLKHHKTVTIHNASFKHFIVLFEYLN